MLPSSSCDKIHYHCADMNCDDAKSDRTWPRFAQLARSGHHLEQDTPGALAWRRELRTIQISTDPGAHTLCVSIFLSPPFRDALPPSSVVQHLLQDGRYILLLRVAVIQANGSLALVTGVPSRLCVDVQTNSRRFGHALRLLTVAERSHSPGVLFTLSYPILSWFCSAGTRHALPLLSGVNVRVTASR